MEKILIVEDDVEIAMLEKDYLEINGYEVEMAKDGNKALEKIKENSYDLILLDIMLPSRNGYDICREVRDLVDIPILMVTARTDSSDKIRGLGLGADDFITKPFDPAELIARVKSHLSRYQRLTSHTEQSCRDDSIISLGNIEINSKSWVVRKKGEEIHLSNREFNLLLFLAENPNLVFSKDQLFEKIWGYDYTGDNATVTVHINRIREKIEDDPKRPSLIETVWGAGYRLNNR